MDRTPCPWYVTASAVRAWQAIDSKAPRNFDDASDALIELCAATWHERYADGSREPRTTRTAAYVYQAGERHGRLRIIVSQTKRPEGDKQQVVDVRLSSGSRKPT